MKASYVILGILFGIGAIGCIVLGFWTGICCIIGILLGILGGILFIYGLVTSDTPPQTIFYQQPLPPVYQQYPPPPAYQQPPPPQQEIRMCLGCGRQLQMSFNVCPYCGKSVNPPPPPTQ